MLPETLSVLIVISAVVTSFTNLAVLRLLRPLLTPPGQSITASPKSIIPGVFRRPPAKRKPVVVTDEMAWKREQDDRSGA